MKKYIIAGLSVALMMILLISSSTFASFGDTETSTGNKATAWTSSHHTASAENEFEVGTLSNVDTSTLPGDVILAKTNYLFACAGGGSNAVYRYNESTYTWESITPVPGAAVGLGGGLSYPGTGNYVYCLKGGGSAEFYRYDISGNIWSVLTSVTAAVTTGGYLRAAVDLYGTTCLYVIQGGSTAFYRYNITANPAHSISADTWTTMATLPNAAGAGASLAWDKSNTLYATRGGGNTTFYSYSISGNAWTTITGDPVSGAINGGSELAYANTTGAYLYVTQGGGTNTGFYQYNPGAISGSRWSTMSPTPAAVNTGGSLRWDDDGFLFAFQGGSNVFWRYNIALNTWVVTLAAVPYSVAAGGHIPLTTPNIITPSPEARLIIS